MLFETFGVGCVVRQGCVMSMLLFNLVVARLIKILTGVRPPGGHTHRLAASAYVGDVAVLEQEREVSLLTSRLDEYGVESGLLANRTKSKALPLGYWRRGEGFPFPYVDCVTILGVTFCRSVRATVTRNWASGMGAFRTVLVDARLRV